MKSLKQVEEFREAFSLESPEHSNYLRLQRTDLHLDLLREELRELEVAMKTQSGLDEVLDALVDLQYVLHGLTLELGFKRSFEAAFNEVHRANMAKVGGPKRADGKILKPEGWKPPNIKRIISIFESE